MSLTCPNAEYSSLQIPPIILAAIPHGGHNDSAEQFLIWHNKISNILAEYNCFPVSGAVDGTETERKLQ